MGGKTETIVEKTETQDPWAPAQPYILDTLSEAKKQFNSDAGKTYFPGVTSTPMSWDTSYALDAMRNRAVNGSPLNQMAQQQAMNTINGDFYNPANDFYKHANKVIDDENMDDTVEDFLTYLSENMMNGRAPRRYIRDLILIIFGLVDKDSHSENGKDSYGLIMKSVRKMTRRSQEHFNAAFSSYLIGVTFNSFICGTLTRRLIVARYELKRKKSIEEAMRQSQDMYYGFKPDDDHHGTAAA